MVHFIKGRRNSFYEGNKMSYEAAEIWGKLNLHTEEIKALGHKVDYDKRKLDAQHLELRSLSKQVAKLQQGQQVRDDRIAALTERVNVLERRVDNHQVQGNKIRKRCSELERETRILHARSKSTPDYIGFKAGKMVGDKFEYTILDEFAPPTSIPPYSFFRTTPKHKEIPDQDYIYRAFRKYL